LRRGWRLEAATDALDLLIQFYIRRIAWPFGRSIWGAGLGHHRGALPLGMPRVLCVSQWDGKSESDDDGCDGRQQSLQIFLTVRSTLVFSWSILASVSL
jgi:hypothetical protein